MKNDECPTCGCPTECGYQRAVAELNRCIWNNGKYMDAYFEALTERDRLASEIERLAMFLADNIQGEPSSQGAVDSAIRVIRDAVQL